MMNRRIDDFSIRDQQSIIPPFPKGGREDWRAAAELIASAGFHGDFSLHPLTGGANNRVFLVEVNNGSRALLKAYFQHPDDPRDRLRAEFSFSSFAWENGLRCLPKPLGCDWQNRLGLYEFVPGRQLLPHEVNEGAVRQALDFYRELNRHKELPGAKSLPEGSEACFTLGNHLRCVERRLQRLRGVFASLTDAFGLRDDYSEINRQAAHFIRNELSEAWRGVADSVRKRAGELGLALDTEIARQDRCLSPSDFGFHNAILSDDGRLRFIDFEYAGWDDPAKTVCDFFCQPAVPVPLDYYDIFVEEMISNLSEPEMYRQRIALLLPVYQLKWCCILLNDFLPVGGQRRRFAGSTVDQEERKAKQLQKARQALQNLTR
ncbi:aminoglycoside phosphotransferase family protein [bacterium]|nr:aminoglycoside phosphotransferase family protein [bacterium]